ncbi:DNA polymerase [Frankliniella fusca]|uniref:DNA polymerase n=1 Tax=Frankliniella fusca TaxID=407009 RepID=A0AAE1HYH8_9NEOP|nr:DNA polymerase [Frankliniella fusca]KAK3931099.1 DNA polymerase [Frankliniella fusca]
MTCTSLPCAWNKGSLKRNPGPIRDTQYDSFKINVKRRAYFDPRPQRLQKNEMTQRDINEFVFSLLGNPKETLFQKHLRVKYEDEEYSLEQLEAVYEQCQQFSDNLDVIPDGSRVIFLSPTDGTKTYELPETSGQSTSKMWGTMRSIHMTGTTAHQALHLSSSTARKNFLRRHLWGLEPFTCAAVRYGRKSEPKALAAYLKCVQKCDSTATISSNNGLLKREGYPEGAASVDGIVHSEIRPPRLLEIKCPYILRNKNPKHFREVLSKTQLDNFCLGWSQTRGTFLKRESPYYSQVQHYLGILGLDVCDFVVWSKRGIEVLEIPFNLKSWEEVQAAQSTLHWQYLMPEYFLQRTVRDLDPRQLTH